MGSLSIFQALSIVANLLSLSMAGGLAFAVLVQPHRNSNKYFFAFFCLVMGCWAITALLINMPIESLQLSGVTLLRLHASVLGTLALSYYFFVVAFIKPQGQVVRVFSVAGVFILLFALGIIWSGQFYLDANALPVQTGTRPALTPLGYLLFGAAVGGFALSFWLILSSDKPHAKLLRVPTLLLISAYAATIPSTTVLSSLDAFLILSAALWMGWAVMRHQVFNPLHDLNTELRTANRDLQQVVSDLAQEKARAEALNTELRDANNYKSEFLANMSHELRTPLNSIIGYSELLRKGTYGGLNEKQSDRLEKIHRNGIQLLDLISNILDLNKIEAGKMRLESYFFDLKALVDEVSLQHREIAEMKGLSFRIDIPASTPRLYADPKRIQQVLDNLLDNAVKFTSKGEVCVGARAITVHQGVISNSTEEGFKLPTIGWLRDGEWVVVNFTDTGIGIAPEDQARIFEEFWQVDQSHTREYSGTGLGLTIAKKLVLMHEGAIWVKSRLETGSTFYLALPADVREAEMPVTKAQYARNA
jgi:signal transduction histidine kinase